MDNKGFTLIELLVVIAIIGTLSSIVLASLNNARNKGTDAAIKADIAGVRAAAEIVYDSLGGYGAQSYTAACGAIAVVSPATTVFNDTAVQKQIDDAVTKGGTDAKCGSTASTYMLTIPLKTANAGAWCIDHSGNSKLITNAQFTAIASITTCP